MQILQVTDLVLKQKDKNEKYGLRDSRYDQCRTELMSTYFSRTFSNMMTPVLEILETMKKEYVKEHSTVCVSHGKLEADARTRGPVQVHERDHRSDHGVSES